MADGCGLMKCWERKMRTKKSQWLALQEFRPERNELIVRGNEIFSLKNEFVFRKEKVRSLQRIVRSMSSCLFCYVLLCHCN